MSLETIDALLARLDAFERRADEEQRRRIAAEVRLERERAMRAELEAALASLVFEVRKRSVLERARDLLSRVKRETAIPATTMAHNDVSEVTRG